jgi:hypothetical protein
MKSEISLEAYGEFKGSTKEALSIIISAQQEMQRDINDLKNWKWAVMGAGSVLGFLSGFLKDWITGGRQT